MRKRPLCMVCLVLLAIQLVRVSFLQNTKDQKPSLAETLISDEKDVICKGTVYKIENKSQSTAIYLKDAVVSCTDQKSKNQTIKEKKILPMLSNVFFVQKLDTIIKSQGLHQMKVKMPHLADTTVDICLR